MRISAGNTTYVHYNFVVAKPLVDIRLVSKRMRWICANICSVFWGFLAKGWSNLDFFSLKPSATPG